MNNEMNLTDKANKALKNPTIKKVLHAKKMLTKYSHRWDWELSSDRMKDWASVLRDFNFIQSCEGTNPKYIEMLDLWEAYCEHNGLSDEVTVQDCLC